MLNEFQRNDLLISIPSVWGIRNIFLSNLYNRLSNNFKIIIATTPEGKTLLPGSLSSQADIWELYPPVSSRMHTLFLESLRNAFFDRHQLQSIRDELVMYRHRNHPLSFKEEFRKKINQSLSLFGRTHVSYQWLVHMEDKSFARILPKELLTRLNDGSLSAGFSTIFKSQWEWVLMRAMQLGGIPTATHVLSFDNLVSFGYLPLQRFNLYMVWSDWVGKQLEEFYDIPASKIVVTGTPQFDFHVSSAYQWNREKTYKALNLDNDKPYFLYCANIYSITAREPELAAHILRAMQDCPELKDYQWVIRLHPMDHYARWQGLLEKYPNVRLSLPWDHPIEETTNWASPSSDDVALLSNSIRYASAVLNMRSTIALDCAVLDVPVINLAFHPDQGSPEDVYYKKAHHTYYYEPITASGAAPLVFNASELTQLLIEAISCPQARSDARHRIRELICGPVDGHSADRISDALLKLS